MRSGEYSLTCEPIYDKGNNLFCIKERPTKTDQQAFRKTKANSYLYLGPFSNKKFFIRSSYYELPHHTNYYTSHQPWFRYGTSVGR